MGNLLISSFALDALKSEAARLTAENKALREILKRIDKSRGIDFKTYKGFDMRLTAAVTEEVNDGTLPI